MLYVSWLASPAISFEFCPRIFPNAFSCIKFFAAVVAAKNNFPCFLVAFDSHKINLKCGLTGFHRL